MEHSELLKELMGEYEITHLRDTVALMESSDYKDRFKGEYWQTKIRYDKLHKMVVKYEANTLDFTPNTPLDILKKQLSYMGMYLYTLEIRAQLEGVELFKE